ncbi:hypothetical protein [Actinopolymorpha sp. B9G3]|uniref:GHMP family kinase ATP-binding protein n=1 Tax=Actinopolymorpha sp. B9G3 TaxID=3158970 RepID=UPI0032D8B93E
MDRYGARAVFTPNPATSTDEVIVEPSDRTKARRAAVLAANACAHLQHKPGSGGHLELDSNVPIGLGMGSSTSDVIAAVRAVAASCNVTLPSLMIARLAVNAENATDPLMLAGRPLLFAQREGRVLEDLGGALPPTVVLGCGTGNGRPVDTLSLPTIKYGDDDLEHFERLRAALRRAVADADVRLLGRVCTESARSNQRVHVKEELGLLEDLAGAFGAAGVQVAHSGNVAGLLFDPRSSKLRSRIGRCARELVAHGLQITGVFRAGGHAVAHQPH